MKILELLNQLIDILPFNQNKDISFRKNIEVAQMDFLDMIALVDENDLKLFLPLNDARLSKRMLIHRFGQIYSKLNDAIGCYYEGKPKDAYRKIHQLLNNVSYIKNLSEDYKGFLTIKDLREFDELNWFRLREITKKETEIPESSHLFHPPFEKRGRISNFRLSISGFPCLYLGDSINLCWAELNKNKKDIYASRFAFTGSQSFLRPLNIAIPEPFTEDIYNHEDNQEVNLSYDAFCFLITFPVIQMCLFRVKNENIDDKFKPEYIIPQLLMQFIREEGYFNSVFYSTTKDSENKSLKISHNLVLPVRKINENDIGFCPELLRNIKGTKPILVKSFEKIGFEKIENELLSMEINFIVPNA